MLEAKRFESIKQVHGGYASWAVWADASEKPKSNVGDMTIFDVDSNPALIEMLKKDVVMVGLNISRSFSEPFRNFHDSDPRANDFKIRYAFKGTAFYGAYMTDIIKGLPIADSNVALKHLKAHPTLIEQNVSKFREELRDLDSKAPTILVFGAAAYKIVAEHIDSAEYSKLIKLTHYSHQISKEKYRDIVLSQIDSASRCHAGS
jgi:hypothetical protein